DVCSSDLSGASTGDLLHRNRATDTVRYELDKPTGDLKIDRPQKYSSVCPAPRAPSRGSTGTDRRTCRARHGWHTAGARLGKRDAYKDKPPGNGLARRSSSG